MMIDYSDHQPYREGSTTPVLDMDGDMMDEEYIERRKFQITEVDPDDDYSPGNSDQYEDYDPQQNYDIQYGSGRDQARQYLNVKHDKNTCYAKTHVTLKSACCRCEY